MAIVTSQQLPALDDDEEIGLLALEREGDNLRKLESELLGQSEVAVFTTVVTLTSLITCFALWGGIDLKSGFSCGYAMFLACMAGGSITIGCGSGVVIAWKKLNAQEVPIMAIERQFYIWKDKVSLFELRIHQKLKAEDDRMNPIATTNTSAAQASSSTIAIPPSNSALSTYCFNPITALIKSSFPQVDIDEDQLEPLWERFCRVPEKLPIQGPIRFRLSLLTKIDIIPSEFREDYKWMLVGVMIAILVFGLGLPLATYVNICNSSASGPATSPAASPGYNH